LNNSRGALRLWSPWTFVIVLLPTAFLSWLFLRPLLWPALTAQELRGKQVYFEGISPAGGKIVAYVGADKVQLPGSAATCALRQLPRARRPRSARSRRHPFGHHLEPPDQALRPQPPHGPKTPGLYRGDPEAQHPQRQ
jgi:hypothetical protein